MPAPILRHLPRAIALGPAAFPQGSLRPFQATPWAHRTRHVVDRIHSDPPEVRLEIAPAMGRSAILARLHGFLQRGLATLCRKKEVVKHPR
jgi:hypothetical protein